MRARRSPAPRLHGTRLKLTPVLVLIIRFDDVLNQFMTHDVALVKVYETDAVNVAKDIPHFDQPRDAVRRKINLGNVAGHYGLGIEAEPGQEHLHLFGRRVLRLVENDK